MRRGIALGTVLMALTLGGCGRHGRLEPPPDPNNPFALGSDDAPAQASTADQPGSNSRLGTHRRKKNPPIRPPHDSFILDPLL